MKKIALFYSSLIALVGGFTACDSDNDDKTEFLNVAPVEMNFSTNARVAFKYVDGKGNNLIDMDDKSTYPFNRTSIISADSIENVKASIDETPNWLSLKKKNDEVVVLPFVFGDHKGVTTTYMYVNGDIDRLQAHYVYSDNSVGGSIYGATLVFLTYNGVVIPSELLQGTSVVTIVKENGKTSVLLPAY